MEGIERIARLEEKVQGVIDDVRELNGIRKEDHHRLRGVEASVSALLDVQREARKQEQHQYQRLVLWLQVAAVIGAIFAGAAGVLAVVLAHS